MNKTLMALPIVALTACSNGAEVGPGLMLDAVTTSHVISNPAYRELNPLVIDDPILGPVSLVAMNVGVRAAFIEMGFEADDVNRVVDTGNMFAGVHNLAFFATQSHPVGIVVGGLAAAIYYQEQAEPEYTIEATSKHTGKTYIEPGEFLFYTMDDCREVKAALNQALNYECSEND